jgi:SAM-dependent methyltransferase
MVKFLISGFVIGGLMMNVANAFNDEETLITHNRKKAFSIEDTKERLKSAANLTLPLEEELALLDQLAQIPLGRFLLENKGLNGEMTAYIILHGPKDSPKSSLEEWMLHKCPVVKATQERFQIFKKQLQRSLKDGMTLASLPCGLMDDLLGLDYSEVKDIKLVGIDLDERSLTLAEENAKNKTDNFEASFFKRDAWHLNVAEEYNLITSNGLNIYEPNDQKVVELYGQFYKALKPGGLLITSFLTPPPLLSKDSPWKNYNPGDVLKQKALFGDIIEASWQCFRTESQTHQQLEDVGFQVMDIIYDTQHMFPTVVARK